jgi:hypothetical protein
MLLETSLRMYFELGKFFGNKMRTEKIKSSNHPPAAKEKTLSRLGACCIALLAESRISIPRIVCHHFPPRLN